MPVVRFLGTGNAFHEDGRGSSCVHVEIASGPSFLVDVGPTAAAAFGRFDVALESLEGLFVTHLHGDHTAGWPFLLLNLSLVVRRSRPLSIEGPVGLRSCLEGLTRLCYGDLLQQPGFEIRFREHAVAERDGQASLIGPGFDLLPMEHHPSSLGFRFHLEEAGRVFRLGLTGDTAWCRNLERLSDRCDLLVAECTTVTPGPAPHVSLAELREKLGRLDAARIVLTHLNDAVAQSLATDPLPRVTAAYDGMVWQPPGLTEAPSE